MWFSLFVFSSTMCIIDKKEVQSMNLKQQEKCLFLLHANDLIFSSYFLSTKNFIQHGNVSTYDHCLSVAYYSFWFSKKFPIHWNDRSLIRGALLHDLYLYDWHEKDASHRFHGFHHPRRARNNAASYYGINSLEENIILSHMWPLTIHRLPTYRESIVVCLVDKIVSLFETFHINVRVNEKLHLS